ncbi:MAG TPA: SAF domain-containing protein [Candidatus Melainabacteria bacterium]|nr:SAF domain-containing protein [Candidatus Melainabacteria bacterium]
MVRNAIFLVLFFAVLGSAYFGWKNSPPVYKNESSLAKGSLAPVVKASTTIQPGDPFNPSNLEVVVVPVNQLPQNAFGGIEPISGRNAAYRIEKDTIISPHDISPESLLLWTDWDQAREDELYTNIPAAMGIVIYPISYIPRGQMVFSLKLNKKAIRFNKIPVDVISSIKAIHGRKARHDIAQGQIITEKDLFPR